MGKRTAILVGKRALWILKRVWGLVWQTSVIYGTFLGLATGTVALVEKTDLTPESPLRAVIDLPAEFSEWLETTRAAALKYLEEE